MSRNVVAGLYRINRSAAACVMAALLSGPLTFAGCDTAIQPTNGGTGMYGTNASDAGSGENANNFDGAIVLPDGSNGLPCDVQTLAKTSCSACHGTTPVAGAPMSLVTWNDFAHPSLIDPTVSFAVRAVIRMQSTKAPMPPGGDSSADPVIIDAWVKAGMPVGSCAK